MIFGTENSLIAALLKAKTLAIAIMTLVSADVQAGTATQFGPPSTDPHNSGGYACYVKPGTSRYVRSLIKDGLYVAHKHMKCHQLIYVCLPRNNKCAVGVVADRGPAVADIDLYENLSHKLGHNGKERAVWVEVTENMVKNGK